MRSSLGWSPPGSRGADVIQQLFWQALSRQQVPRGRLDTLPLQPPPASRCSSATGELQDGSEGGKAGEERILLLTPFCRVFFGKKRIWIYCLEDLIDFLLNGLYRSTRTLVNVLSADAWPSQENKICIILLIFTAKQKLGLKRELLFLL